VQFAGGVSATPIVQNNGSLTVQVPAGAQTGNVTVVTAEGTSGGIAFTVTPNITGLNPSQGDGGTAVTITGTTLNVGTVTVSYNGTTLTPTSITAHQILLTLPDGVAAVGFSGPFTVTTRDGSANSANFTFTLNDGDGDLGMPGGDGSIFSDTDGDGV
jgi:hypothetical protein